MIRIAISVEGPTEDEFCKQVLSPYFRAKNIEITPVIVATKREGSGRKHKGGGINLDRIRNEITKLLPSFDYVTTFYDLYGFNIKGTFTAEELEEKIGDLFSGNKKLLPYIQKYEFETLLFSKPEYYGEYFKVSAKTDIEEIIQSCGGVENINNSKETAPSKRIIKFFEKYDERYDKVFHGASIADDIGLDIIKNMCPRFSEWLTNIESINT